MPRTTDPLLLRPGDEAIITGPGEPNPVRIEIKAGHPYSPDDQSDYLEIRTPGLVRIDNTLDMRQFSVRQAKPGASSGCNSHPGKRQSHLTRNRVLGSWR